MAVDGKVVGKKVKTEEKRGVALRFRSYALPAGAVQGARLVWKIKVDGQVKKTIRQDAVELDRAVVKKRVGTGTHKVVILKNGSKVEVYKLNKTWRAGKTRRKGWRMDKVMQWFRDVVAQIRGWLRATSRGPGPRRGPSGPTGPTGGRPSGPGRGGPTGPTGPIRP